MSEREFYTPLEPVERTLRIKEGQEAIKRALREPLDGGTVDNGVVETGTFRSDGGNYDRFTVTLNSARELPDGVAEQRMRALGASSVKRDGRLVRVTIPHAVYDRRWLWCRIDMSTPQLCVAGLVLALALACGAAATLL